MAGGLEFLFWTLFFGLGLIVWGVCELVEWRRRLNRPLPAPRRECCGTRSREWAGR